MAKIILTNEVSGLGSAGDVVEVKEGYARNYLVPKGFAVNWSRGGERQVEELRAGREAREQKSVEAAQELKERLESALVKVAVKSGAEGRLFGSVRTQDVAEAVKEQGIGEIDKRAIEFPNPIKTIGTHEATVRLREDVSAVIRVQVVTAR